MTTESFSVHEVYSEIGECMTEADRDQFMKLTYKYHRFFKHVLTEKINDCFESGKDQASLEIMQ